jgi:hypothetical protein
VIFSQGDEANAVFYIQSERAKLTVVSKGEKRISTFGATPGKAILIA